MIGYRISSYQEATFRIDDFFLEECYCKPCLGRKNFSVTQKFGRLSTKWDVFYTKDGALVISKKIANLFKKEEIIAIDNENNFFFVSPSKVVNFDAVRRNSVVGETCPECQINKYAAGAEPVLLNVEQIEPFGVYRTDIHFANGEYRQFALICGLDFGEAIKSADAKGLTLMPAYGNKDKVTTKTGVVF